MTKLILICPPSLKNAAEGYAAGLAAADEDREIEVQADPDCAPGKFFLVDPDYFKRDFA